jgi:CBS domain-containing protein
VFVGGMFSVVWDSLSPLWFVLVGSFLERLAYFSVYRLRTAALPGRVAEFARRDFGVIAPSATLEEARALFERGAPAHLVADGGRVFGVISRAHMASAAEAAWPATRVSDVMEPCGQGAAADAGESAKVVLRRMLELGLGCMPVLDGNKVIGIVTRGDLVAAISQEHKLDRQA